MSRAERIEEALRAALPCLGQMDPPCDGVRWHHAREARAALALPADAPAHPAPEGAALLPWSMFCYVCGEPAACVGYELGEGPGAHTLNGCCNDHCGHANESEKCVPIGTHPTPRAEAASAEAVREACAKACDDLVARANEKVREWSMSDHGREAAAMVERYHASAYREAAAAIRSLPLPTAPASAEAVADSIIDAIVAETRAHLERMERLWGDLSRAASSPGGAA